MSVNTETEFLKAYKEITEAHKKVLEQLNRAIELDECDDKPSDASAAYEQCIREIHSIFDIRLGLPDNIENIATEWRDACNLIQELKKTEIDVQQRLKMLEQRHPTLGSNVSKTADQNICRFMTHVNDGDISTMYKKIIDDVKELIMKGDSDKRFDILFHSRVKLYKIERDGVVKTLSSETNMDLILCTNFWEPLINLYFIKCSITLRDQPDNNQLNVAENAAALDNREYELIWIYPLLPCYVTCYVTDYNAFILPDLKTDRAGGAYGIILKPPTELNEEAAKDFQQFFADLLEAVLRTPVAPITFKVEADLDIRSERVAKGINVGANFIARNIIRAAEKSGELMVKSTPYIISKLQPAQENTVTISPMVQSGVQVARGATSTFASGTLWLVGKVGALTRSAGQYLAPYVQNGGATVLQKVFNCDSENAQNTMEGALTVAAGAVQGISTIIDGLEKSAAILGNNISENSVKIIQHKYGSSAASVAADTFDTLGNAFVVSRNVNYVVPKGIAKNLVKNTGKAVIIEYNRCRNTPQYITAGHLYPDLRHLRKVAVESTT